MKRFTSFLFALLAVVCSFSAAAADVNFKLVIDNPAAVKCYISGETKDLVQGENECVAPEYTNVVLESVAPYAISKVANAAGTPVGNMRDGGWTNFMMSSNEGDVYYVTTINLDDQRDSECTIIVDDPTLVSASLSGFGQVLTLNEGSNTVKFMSDKEKELYLSSTDWTKPLYEVTLNDVVLKKQEYSNDYTVTLTDGCVVNITAKIPEKDVTITFEYTSEEAKGSITDLKVNGEAVAEFDGSVVNMKTGQSLAFSANPEYKIEAVKLNDEQISFYGYYSTDCVLNDMKFTVTAHPYGKVNYTVNIDDPENIIFREGNAYNGTVLPLVAGDNKFEISEADTQVTWEAVKGAYIVSASIDGKELTYGSTNVEEGSVITITTAKIVYDKTAVVWIDDMTNVAENSGSFNLRTGNEAYENAVAGYNVIPFYDKMLPFDLSVSCYAEGVTLVNKIYVDGELQTPGYTSGNYASFMNLPIADKSVLKVFLSEEPVNCNVTFNAPESLEATVTYDRVKTLGSLADGLACFKGTEVAIEGTDDLTVKVGETELEKNDDGKFVFTVADPATTVTLADKSSGVENVVLTTEADANEAVYTLMGVRVGTRAQLNTLPAGIYVLNGQKVIVK